jgi:hypothetical protein
MNATLPAKDVAQHLGIRATCNYSTMRDYALAKVPFPQHRIFGYLALLNIARKLQD